MKAKKRGVKRNKAKATELGNNDKQESPQKDSLIGSSNKNDDDDSSHRLTINHPHETRNNKNELENQNKPSEEGDDKIDNHEDDEDEHNSHNNQSLQSNTNSSTNNNNNNNDNNNDNHDHERQPPLPKFKIKQKVLARDTDTPLLYEAIVRKHIYAPKSKQVQICKVQMNIGTPDQNDEFVQSLLDDELLDNLLSQGSSSSLSDEANHNNTHSWHYFVHYQGWNVTWDRWVEECNLFEDKESTRILAQRLKNESKCLKKGKGKGKSSDKVVMDVMQKIMMIEKEFRDKEARGEVLTAEDSIAPSSSVTAAVPRMEGKSVQFKTDKDKKNESNNNIIISTTSKANDKAKATTATAKFVKNEVQLRMRDLCSKKTSNAINIPFTIKKVLTDEWEVISQCGMVHNLPASVSVMDVLNAYLNSKILMLRMTSSESNNNDSSTNEEKKEDISSNSTSPNLNPHHGPSSEQESIRSVEEGENGDNIIHHDTRQEGGSVGDGGTNALHPTNAAEQEWQDMTEGLAMYFDQMLPKQLLYRHELPQCLVLEGQQYTTNKRYCELYPCEHLLRLCLFKLPELVEEAKDLTDGEKSKIIFKVGDLVRFLQKHQDVYLLQRYRKLNGEESEKAKRLKSRLGLRGGVKKESRREDEENDDGGGGGDGDDGDQSNSIDDCEGKSDHDVDEKVKKRKRKGDIRIVDKKGGRKKNRANQ